MSDNNFDDGSIDIQEWLNSDDEELKALAEEILASEQDTTESVEEHDATQSVAESEPETDNGAQSPDAKTDTADDEPAPDGVLSKDGKHVIPYEVLEQQRQQNAQLRQENEQIKAQQSSAQAQMDKLNRTFELAKQKGVDLPTLPEDERITDEQIAEIEDLSPEFASMARQLRYLQNTIDKQNQQLSQNNAQQQANQAQSENPEFAQVQQAVQANPAIQEILRDADMKAMAETIEVRLMEQGGFDSLAARYAEVAKRVGSAFGIDFAAKYGATVYGQQASSKAPNEAPAAPQSLSDMPASNNMAGKSAEQLLAEQDENQLEESLAKANQATLNEILGL